MDMEEILYKMDLTCVYSDGEISETEYGFYVYLIVNKDKYYVGLSKSLKSRIHGHFNTNTNNICDEGTCVYILEKLNYEKDMRIMEYLWIVWFGLNTDCVNVAKTSYKIRVGKINKHTINYINPNYKVFCDFEYIIGLKLLDRYTMTNITEIDYFGKTL
jgi:hypothetical protein